ncbi:MAG: rRNA maturation RNase YbeY [Candidatus Omnitrophica bacterium]|nr:rRNA maturation RNase YbeY [Candidatus Omnitrophota bacterium]MCM8792902.1 rRNA maturation RNase YbeY [Candidatus Omnitrophota bacterium]
MKIEVIRRIKKKIPCSQAEIRNNLRKVLRLLKIKNGSLNVVIVSDHFIRKLNRRFLNKDRVTDVLAFGEEGKEGIKNGFLGEVVVSLDTAKRVARRYGKRIEEEFFLYLVHGILHLIGYTDRTLRERKAMEEMQNKIVTQLFYDKK